MKCYYFLLLTAALLPWALGCPKPASTTAGTDEHAEHEGEDGHEHSHDEGDELFWHRAELEHEGYVISLGQHGAHVHTGHASEPAVMITKDGQPVADAQVFITLLDEAGGTVLTEEAATIYEPATAAEPAHYAQAEVKVPKDAKNVTLRYRLVLPGASDFQQDVLVATETH